MIYRRRAQNIHRSEGRKGDIVHEAWQADMWGIRSCGMSETVVFAEHTVQPRRCARCSKVRTMMASRLASIYAGAHRFALALRPIARAPAPIAPSHPRKRSLETFSGDP